MLRCAACHRQLLDAAFTHASGWHLGPVCLEKERSAGRLPTSGCGEIRSQPRKPASKRKPVKRIKRVAQVQDDLFCDWFENGGDMD